MSRSRKDSMQRILRSRIKKESMPKFSEIYVKERIYFKESRCIGKRKTPCQRMQRSRSKKEYTSKILQL